jgi:hypothetical protein
LEKHVDGDHVTFAEIFEEMKFPLRNVLKKQVAKKRPNVFNFKISKFLV